MQKILAEVKDMYCYHCEEDIVEALEKIDGVLLAGVDFKHNRLVLAYDEKRFSKTQLSNIVTSVGFTVTRVLEKT